jgi:predicted acyltransferase
MRFTWLLRMARWVRHPPSERQVIIGLVVLACALVLFGLEWLGLLPAWFALDPRGLRP